MRVLRLSGIYMNHSFETKLKIGNSNRKQLFFFCDYCGRLAHSKPSHYARKIKHFCNKHCYSEFRKNQLPFYKQNTYLGIRKPGENKQVYHRNYCKNHPENIAHLKARRYARERGAEGSHMLNEWEHLKEKHNHACAYCNKKKPLTKDHIIPLSEGGTDYIENIQPLCRNCNSKKWKHIHENPELLS